MVAGGAIEGRAEEFSRQVLEAKSEAQWGYL